MATLKGYRRASLAPIESISHDVCNNVQASRFPIPPPDRRAIVTSLYTGPSGPAAEDESRLVTTRSDVYADAIKVLGHSADAARVQARKVLIYTPDTVSERVLCELGALGWELEPRARIEPPYAGVFPQYRDQYTKLHVRVLNATVQWVGP